MNLNIIKDVGLFRIYSVKKTATKNSNSQNNHAAPRDTTTEHEAWVHSSLAGLNNRDFQAAMLKGVSRTFALTIPQLPEALRDVVSNAYLLCRTVDTIEDEPQLNAKQKKIFSAHFLEILLGQRGADQLTEKLSPLLSDHTIPAEHQLIKELGRVVAITQKFDPSQQQSLVRCVRIMSEGMVYFQEHSNGEGLKDQAEMDLYCYYVAGVVGEMLTELFCLYSPEIAKNKDELFLLSRSFGQGLQMTNILKDIWDDQSRSACWLPKNLFEQEGLELSHMEKLVGNKKFQKGLSHLIGIAHTHLNNALTYTLMIPAHEKGIREFCLWALGMAMLTLRKINGNLGFTDGDQVKISRKSVKATVAVTRFTVKHDALLKLLFKWLSRGLPKGPMAKPGAT